MSSVKGKSATFEWSEAEHRQYLSACLSAFPQELVNIIGSLVPVWEWSATQKSSGIVLSCDDTGLQRVACYTNSQVLWRSVMSRIPLSPPSSSASSATSSASSSSSLFSSPSPSSSCSPSSSSVSHPEPSRVAAFEVRVDQLEYEMHVGVSCELPPDDEHVGWGGCGLGYHSEGTIDGLYKVRGVRGYGTGDVIRVEVDFGARTLAFFKNGKLQGRSVDVSKVCRSGIDLAKPLYAVVTMGDCDDQVTLL